MSVHLAFSSGGLNSDILLQQIMREESVSGDEEGGVDNIWKEVLISSWLIYEWDGRNECVDNLCHCEKERRRRVWIFDDIHW